ncbi:MAG: MFS transporter [Dehalococcoidia bacterium]|nr:MFS transporter [Dehalococcoidia bacterium]
MTAHCPSDRLGEMFSRLIAKLHQLHYAWVILAAVIVINTLSSGVRLSFGVFIDPLEAQFGWSRGAISFAYTITFLAALPATVLVGRLGDIVGVRRLVSLAAITTAIGLILTAFISRLWHFYIFYGVIVGGLGTALYQVLMPVTITKWFDKKLGLAMGIMWTSLSIGPIIFSPLIRWLLENKGWKPTMIAMGLGLGIGLTVMSFFLRGNPKEKGLKPYGASVEEIKEKTPTSTPSQKSPSMSFSQVRRQPVFWALISTHFLGCVSHSIPLAHIVSMATGTGIPGVTAAGLLSALSASALGSRFFMSILSERGGSRITLGLAFLFQGTPLLILLWFNQLWGFYLFAILFGIGFGGEMVGYPIFNRQLYGINAPLSLIYSFEMIGALLGMALGGWVGGYLYDVSGNYTWTIITAVVASYIGLAFVTLLPRHRNKIALSPTA